ncbi:hypothetical protein BDW02DRAFT_273677 [Decorospora gaudefroyi]|uniref:Uncharacterized protein n=1 Tax=Decorospora gaudefroyi TaxID=184978 RepID=A0A6A5KS58_9PLEO|nr:hypothetical protein BDW02DRAFT_273677 [Decorospora gaudefroyi]
MYLEVLQHCPKSSPQAIPMSMASINIWPWHPTNTVRGGSSCLRTSSLSLYFCQCLGKVSSVSHSFSKSFPSSHFPSFSSSVVSISHFQQSSPESPFSSFLQPFPTSPSQSRSFFFFLCHFLSTLTHFIMALGWYRHLASTPPSITSHHNISTHQNQYRVQIRLPVSTCMERCDRSWSLGFWFLIYLFTDVWSS